MREALSTSVAHHTLVSAVHFKRKVALTLECFNTHKQIHSFSDTFR